jgi:hypothetical protein
MNYSLAIMDGLFIIEGKLKVSMADLRLKG